MMLTIIFLKAQHVAMTKKSFGKFCLIAENILQGCFAQ